MVVNQAFARRYFPGENPYFATLGTPIVEGRAILVRTSGAAAGIVPQVRKTLAALDRDQAISEVRTLEDVLDQTLARRRLALSLFGAFSALALFLAAVGLYAVISYSVQQRRREIGIRLALGARSEQVAGTVVRRGVALIGAGTLLGALAALGLGRFLVALVFGVGTTDPTTYVGVAGLLITTALVASLVPALRAARVDPATVLRSE